MILLYALACSFDNDQTGDPESEAIAAVKGYTAGELTALADAAVDLRDASPDADGWAAGDTADIESAWYDVRTHYERIEGAIAVLFPELDVSTDQRYDAFIADGPDEDLFDGEIVTGDHAIERIIWAERIPAPVLAFEQGLPYYSPAALPADEAEATRFRDELCQRFVDDTASMETQFEPLALDAAAAFRGVIGSMAEQYEKASLASTGQDESRYSAHTLGDMRANLEGGETIYEAFTPWLTTLDGGADLDADILAGFARVDAGYAAIEGDAIPEVPATWNPDDPSAEDLATPYGQLYTLLSTEADPTIEGSLVHRMTAAADLLGIAQIP